MIARNQMFEVEALPWVEDVHRFALSLTRDESDADDVVQDTYLRAFKSWHTYVPGSDCRRWLFTICRNVFLRSLERRTPTVDLGTADADGSAAGAMLREVSDAGLEQLFARVDLGPALESALTRVPEPFRSAVLLVDVEDQSYDDAAQRLGVPIGTVRSRLFRGRRLRQELLDTYARDAGIEFAGARC